MVVRLIAAAALAAGCAWAAEPVRFTERKLERKVAGCEVDFRWLEATSGPAEVRSRINAAIVEAFFAPPDVNGERSPLPTRATFKQEAESFIASCREDRDKESLMVWSLDIGMGTLRTQPVISFEFGSESYAGGGHASAAVWYLNLDAETGRAVQLGSMLSDGALPRLTEIAERHFRDKRELSPTGDLKAEGFWWKDGRFHLNENYGFGETSLTFFYNQYEIGPYGMGVTQVEVPYKEILDLLRPEFRKAFTSGAGLRRARAGQEAYPTISSGTPPPPAAAK